MPRFSDTEKVMEEITIKTRNELVKWQHTFGMVRINKPIVPSYAALECEFSPSIDYTQLIYDNEESQYTDYNLTHN